MLVYTKKTKQQAFIGLKLLCIMKSVKQQISDYEQMLIST
jgi:hypothetical protein